MVWPLYIILLTFLVIINELFLFYRIAKVFWLIVLDMFWINNVYYVALDFSNLVVYFYSAFFSM